MVTTRHATSLEKTLLVEVAYMAFKKCYDTSTISKFNSYIVSGMKYSRQDGTGRTGPGGRDREDRTGRTGPGGQDQGGFNS